MNTRNALSVLKATMKKQWLIVSFFAVITFLTVVLMTGVTIFTNRVYITDGDNVRCILTTSEDVNEILKDNGYKLLNDDIIDFNGFKDNTGNVKINRAFDVKLTTDGMTVEIPMARGTVSDVLTKANVTVSDDDLLNIGLNEPVNADTDIVIQRVTHEVVATDTAIPFETTTINNPNLSKGKETVKTEGVEGSLQTVQKYTYVDGELTTTTLISETVLKPAVNKVVTVGTATRTPISQVAPQTLAFDNNGVPLNYKKVLTGKSAAYSARPGAKTASGRLAQVGTVAVNPKVIPYGTKLYITSTDGKHVYGYAIAADTGGALMDGRIIVDLFMANNADCSKWGIQQVNVYVL